MSGVRIDLRTLAPQPWKNGAGLTREIAWGGPDAAAFDWRLSLAQVERDAPFSAFPGIDRSIVLMSGDGLQLRSADGAIDHVLDLPLRPYAFSGDVALAATLLGGATRDFNVMTRRGAWRSVVETHTGACVLAPFDAAFALCTAGDWTGPEEASLAPMQGLLWRAPADRPVTLQPQRSGATLLLVRLLRAPHP